MTELSRCKQCGEYTLDPNKAVGGVLKCDICGAIRTFPKSDSAALAFLRQGEHDLDACDFEKAYTAYQKAAELDKNEPEAYFGMALSAFRVQYLKDEVNHHLQPICHEISEKVFTEDKNYKKALELATLDQKKVYRAKGGEIDDIRDEFFALKKSGTTYDCFLCVKVTQEDGSHTRDYERANDIYYHLKENGYRPFFSEREMKGRSGSNYEALILYALYTSECMLIVCSDEGYLQTKWVKNEYTRFLSMIAGEEKERDAVTFAFYGNPIEKLPGRNGKLQGIDLSKPDAYSRIVAFVENHTPEARKRREEELSRQTAEEEQQRNLRAQEFQEQRRVLEEERKKLEELLDSSRKQEEAKKAEEARRVQEAKRAEAAQKAEEARRVQEAKKAEAAQKAEEAKKAKEAKKQAKRKKQLGPPRGYPTLGSYSSSQFRIDNKVLEIHYAKAYSGKVKIPYGVTKIGHGAFFHNCITSVTIPNTVTRIDSEAFAGCTSLKTVVIPSSVTEIGIHAFEGCTSLKTVSIPSSVVTMGPNVFYRCVKLKKILCEAESAPPKWYGWNGEERPVVWGAKIKKQKI